MTNHCQALLGSLARCGGVWCGVVWGALRQTVPPSAGDVITFICDTRIRNLLQLRLVLLLLLHNYCRVTRFPSTCHAHRVVSLYKSLAVNDGGGGGRRYCRWGRRCWRGNRSQLELLSRNPCQLCVPRVSLSVAVAVCQDIHQQYREGVPRGKAEGAVGNRRLA